jgi:hypothetical protein
MNSFLDKLTPQSLLTLLPPAIIISVVAYLVHFFGKIIADQWPYADDREWYAEISGIYFLLGNVIFYGILGMLLALWWGGLGTGHWWRFIIVILCGSYLWAIGCLLAEKVYGLKNPLIRYLLDLYVKDWKDMTADKLRDGILKFDRWVPTWLFSIIFAYILTLEFRFESWGWLLIIGIEIFISLIFMALNYSLMRIRLPQVDILFANGDDHIRDVTLIKVSDDDIRIRKEDQIMIVNRSQVKQIDFYPPKQGDIPEPKQTTKLP